MPLTDAGYQPRTAAEYLQIGRDEVDGLLGYSIDWDDHGSVVSALLTVTANRLGELDEGNAAAFDAFDPGNARGQQLASLFRVFSILRQVATPSQVTATIEGTAGTVIPPTAEIRPVGESVGWLASRGGSVGESIVWVRKEPGPYVPTSSDWEIVTPVSGWSGVSQVGGVSAGIPDESDGAYRRRAMQSRSRTGLNTAASMQSELRRLPFLTDAYVIDNDDNAPRALGGVTIPAKSIAAFVLPTNLTDDQQAAVAAAIAAVKPLSVKVYGVDVATTVQIGDVQAMAIGFSYGVERPAAVEVVAARRSGFSASVVRRQIESALDAYALTLGLGDGLCRLDLLGLISDLDSVKSASVLIDGADQDLEAGPIEVITFSTASGLSVVVS